MQQSPVKSIHKDKYIDETVCIGEWSHYINLCVNHDKIVALEKTWFHFR